MYFDKKHFHETRNSSSYLRIGNIFYRYDIYGQQRNNKLDTNCADEKRTRNKQKRDVFSTLKPFKLMLS